MLKRAIRRNRLLRVGVPAALITAGAIAVFQSGAPASGYPDPDLKRITAAGELKAIMGKSPPSHPAYLNQPPGFDFELARELEKTARERLEDVYRKHYAGIEKFDYCDLKTFHDRMRSRLPRYQAFIKDAARKHGFDWCLVAAQMYRESRLDALARSPDGAQGLMQILPGTARSLDLADAFDPVANIRAGVRYLKSLHVVFEGLDEQDRLSMSLAAYNVGLGHVLDARRLASNMGLDPNRWDSLAKTLPLLRLREYYQHAEQGFCQGDIPVAYVNRIMVYYDILKRIESDTALAAAAVSAGGAYQN
jgi:membrane-bound lytic murein transglycosylase MltF